MLSKKRQREYFLQRWNTILHHYDQFATRTNADDLHKIRVELKKIRAILFLHEKTGGNISKREQQLIRTLFQQAGKIRDAQVTALLVKKAGAGSVQFFTEHRNTVASESKKFIKLFANSADQIVKQNTRVWKSFEGISFSQLEKVFSKLMKKIKAVYVPRLIQNDLHESRKAIKRIVYIHSMLKDKSAKKLKLKVDQLRVLEETVGKWHDAEVTIALLKAFPRKKPAMTKLVNHKKLLLTKTIEIARTIW